MVKKITGVIVLIVFLTIYVVSSSSELTNKLAKQNAGSHPFIQSDKFRYGDLFGMSFLPEYQVPTVAPSVTLFKCNAALNINLSVICDSYVENFIADKSYYCGVDNFYKALVYDTVPLQVTINRTKRNILLIEIAERNLRLTLNRTEHMKNLVAVKRKEEPVTDVKPDLASFLSNARDFVFNRLINTNLELNTWGYSIFTPLKKLRAELNYRLFNIVDKNVLISPDKKYLFYNITVDSSAITSSFQSVPDSEIRFIVEKLNDIYHRSKDLGFNEVYLSIIPNAVSLLYPVYNGMQYNQLVSRVENAAGLKMPFIDIYSTFKSTPVLMSQRSDSHWSRDGAYTWLNKINRVLVDVSN